MKIRGYFVIFIFFLASGCLTAENKTEFTAPHPVLNISIPENISIAGEIQLINDKLEINNETDEPVFNESLDDKDPSWSPDGNWIVFDSKRAGNRDIWLMDSKGNNLKRFTLYDSTEQSPRFSPDGKKIAFERHGYTNGIYTHGIWIMDSSGENIKEIVNCAENCMSPSWSPDGSKIAYSIRGKIWEADLNKNLRKQLTNGTAVDLYPSWSPDGKKIAFSSTESGDTEIWVMDSDGGNRKKLTTRVGLDLTPSWSPDGNWIVFSSIGDIWVMKADGTEQKALTEWNLFVTKGNPSWSPDGSKIAFDSNKAGTRDIWILLLIKEE
ncbi:MAG: hypothetical protein AABZ36_03865 [Nitrospirota bacterium]